MQIWQLFIILKQPVHISVTVFYNLTKLANHLFILVGPTVTRPLQDPLAVLHLKTFLAAVKNNNAFIYSILFSTSVVTISYFYKIKKTFIKTQNGKQGA